MDTVVHLETVQIPVIFRFLDLHTVRETPFFHSASSLSVQIMKNHTKPIPYIG